mmetsp:Transcript_5960/g.10715  ORF Transcript_5960/g.10715 Transcript_5960/m.10715 type:complete len:705 (-) Transcript_5960:17-2131(-)
MNGGGASLQWHGSYSSGAARPQTAPAPSGGIPQWPPQRGGAAWQVIVADAAPSAGASQASAPSQGPGLSEEYANKVAELTVLRGRLQQFERENARLLNDLAAAKEQAPQSEKVRQRQAEVERLQGELQGKRQDLISSEDERKRLKLTLDEAQRDLAAVRGQQPQQQPLPQQQHQLQQQQQLQQIQQQQQQIQQLQQQLQQHKAQPIPQLATAQQIPQADVQHSKFQQPQDSWRREVLLRELAAWEAAHKVLPVSTCWFALREAVSDLRPSTSNSVRQQVGNHAILASTIVEVLERDMNAQNWSGLRGGARFVKLLFGLFPEAAEAAYKAEASAATVLSSLSAALHAAVLEPGTGEIDPETMEVREACAKDLLEALINAARKIQPSELHHFESVLQRPSLCALLNEDPGLDTLHLPCFELLQALLSSSRLFALAHQADSEENPLLAAANLLIVPSIGLKADAAPTQSYEEADDVESATIMEETQAEHEKDSPERQCCRVAALELICRCLATAPRPDYVLQLRGAPLSDGEVVDTVLQRVVLLCHHELLCLQLHGCEGGPWQHPNLAACAARRQRAVDLSLLILSSFSWHAAPWTPEEPAKSQALCAEACDQLGRSRALLESIVDMVVQRVQGGDEDGSALGRVAAMRPLLAFADGIPSKPAECTAEIAPAAASVAGPVPTPARVPAAPGPAVGGVKASLLRGAQR